MQFEFRAEGFDEMEEIMRRLPFEVVRHTQGAAILDMCRIIRKNARALVRVDSGDLKRSIRARRLPTTLRGRKIPGGAGGVFAGGKGAFHAHLVELGTVKTPARPFLRPAFEADRAGQQRAYQDRLRVEIPKVLRALATGTQTRTVTRLAGG